MAIVCYSIMPLAMRWYERRLVNCLTFSFFDMNSFFTEWNAIVLLNINRNYRSCPGTTHMSLIVGDWICSVINKTTMEPGPWTLVTCSTYVLISWTQAMRHWLYGMWCNIEPLSMICLVFTQALSVLGIISLRRLAHFESELTFPISSLSES